MKYPVIYINVTYYIKNYFFVEDDRKFIEESGNEKAHDSREKRSITNIQIHTDSGGLGISRKIFSCPDTRNVIMWSRFSISRTRVSLVGNTSVTLTAFCIHDAPTRTRINLLVIYLVKNKAR